MCKTPLISIVSPSLNQGKYIEEMLLSVYGQDYPAIEHIIIDGGSTDNTLEVVEKHREKIAVWISEKDEGTSEAINKGFKMAKGEFVWILNTDDMLVQPDALSLLAEYLLQHPECDFVFGNMHMIDANGQAIGNRTLEHLDLTQLFLDWRQLPFAGCLLRKNVLDDIGYFDLNLKYSNDHEFYFRLAGSKKMALLNRFTGIFRYHDSASSSSSLNIYQVGQEKKQVCLKYLQQYNSLLNVPENRVKSSIYLFSASCSFHSAKASETRKNVLHAIFWWPKSIFNPKIWVYFFLSLLGDTFTARAGQLFRNLIHRKFWFTINNWWY